MTTPAPIEIALVEPEIPPNTGAVARTCAATKTPLHLIEPLGFSISDKHLKRAGLDYWPHVDLAVWPDFQAFLAARPGRRWVMPTAANRGQKVVPSHRSAFAPGDILVFGRETRGLADHHLSLADALVTIPIWGQVRSLNLANAATTLLYEALRQLGAFPEDA